MDCVTASAKTPLVQREFARPVVKPHVWGDAKMSRDSIGCCWAAAAAAAAAGSQIAAVAAVWRQAWSYKKTRQRWPCNAVR
jgi:hypothetical protein